MTSVDKDYYKLTYKEYVLYPDDGNRHEVIDGEHYVNPAPSTYHQTVSKRLQYQLYRQIELGGLGQVFDAPIDLQLTKFDIVQPDLLVLLNESKAKITPAKIIGPPDLLIEILSPSSQHNDLELKRRLYEKTGVSEYWIVDPLDHQIKQLRLENGKYQEQPMVETEIRMAVLDRISIQLVEIW